MGKIGKIEKKEKKMRKKKQKLRKKKKKIKEKFERISKNKNLGKKEKIRYINIVKIDEN